MITEVMTARPATVQERERLRSWATLQAPLQALYDPIILCALLRHEILHRNRDHIVSRLWSRLWTTKRLLEDEDLETFRKETSLAKTKRAKRGKILYYTGKK